MGALKAGVGASKAGSVLQNGVAASKRCRCFKTESLLQNGVGASKRGRCFKTGMGRFLSKMGRNPRGKMNPEAKSDLDAIISTKGNCGLNPMLLLGLANGRRI